MTLIEAIAQQPQWVQLWVNILLVVGFILPLALLIWPQSRVAGMLTALGSVIAGTLVDWIYGALGYVKLLGLPHIVIWVPVVVFLLAQIRREDMPVWPKRIMSLIAATLIISLAFDIVDVLRYILGNRMPTVLPV